MTDVLDARIDSIIRPFDDQEQDLLKNVDRICVEQARRIREEKHAVILAGEEVEYSEDDKGWLAIITAYGLLYNMAVQAGWIQDAYMEGNTAQ